MGNKYLNFFQGLACISPMSALQSKDLSDLLTFCNLLLFTFIFTDGYFFTIFTIQKYTECMLDSKYSMLSLHVS